MSRLHQRVLLSYSGISDHTTSGSGNNHRLPSLAFASSGGGGGSRPGLSFPLGTGLVVLIILFVSALFSFCYHWLTLKKSRTSAASTTAPDLQQQSQSSTLFIPHDDAAKPLPAIAKLDTVQCPPVVYMAGEFIPRFIAVPCPFVAASLSTPAPDDTAAAQSKAFSHEDLKLDVRL